MKYLKSTISDLKKLLESSILVKDIAEPFASFDFGTPVTYVIEFMNSKYYDIIGIRKEGLIAGYATKQKITGNMLGDNFHEFNTDELLSENESIKEIFHRIVNSPYDTVFLIILGEIGGIITKGDLQKIPVRMWIFGLISMIEMQCKRVINNYFSDDYWMNLLKENRLDEARKIQRDRKEKKLDIGLLECLQICDLREILLTNNILKEKLEIKSKCSGKKLFMDIENIRNKLAHAQDIISGNWPEIIDIIKDAEDLLDLLEKI